MVNSCQHEGASETLVKGSIFLQDIQVPVCPLCNIPIPVKRGEMPDIKVGEHIDRDCRSDPAQRKRKVQIALMCPTRPSVSKQ